MEGEGERREDVERDWERERSGDGEREKGRWKEGKREWEMEGGGRWKEGERGREREGRGDEGRERERTEVMENVINTFYNV